jgi:hypothetical protein
MNYGWTVRLTKLINHNHCGIRFSSGILTVTEI